MSQLVTVTALQRKAQSSTDWQTFAKTIAIDTDDISGFIRRDTVNNWSYFDINPLKDSVGSAKNSTRYQLRVTDTLAAIAALSTNLVNLSVVSRRGTTVSYGAVFVVSRFVQNLETVTGGTSTRFWYVEDGDTLPVEYVVSNTITNIISQTNIGSADTLAQTLIYGNSTGGTNIVLSNNDTVRNLAGTEYLKLNTGEAKLSSATQTTLYSDTLVYLNAPEVYLDSPLYTFSQLSASTVPYLDASKRLRSSAVTPTQLSYLDATSSIQTQLNSKAALTDLVGLWDDRGSFNASVNAYPSSGGSGSAGAILKGDIWIISVAGTLPTGQVVEIGDMVRALADTPGNTQANWGILQNNIGYITENSANKDTDGTLAANSDTKYASQKAVKTYIDNLAVTKTVSSAVTLLLAITTKYYVFTGGAATVWTLPATINGFFFIKNRGSAVITLNSDTGNQIYTTSAVSSVTINPGESFIFAGDGTYYNVM